MKKLIFAALAATLIFNKTATTVFASGIAEPAQMDLDMGFNIQAFAHYLRGMVDSMPDTKHISPDLKWLMTLPVMEKNEVPDRPGEYRYYFEDHPDNPLAREFEKMNPKWKPPVTKRLGAPTFANGAANDAAASDESLSEFAQRQAILAAVNSARESAAEPIAQVQQAARDYLYGEVEELEVVKAFIAVDPITSLFTEQELVHFDDSRQLFNTEVNRRRAQAHNEVLLEAYRHEKDFQEFTRQLPDQLGLLALGSIAPVIRRGSPEKGFQYFFVGHHGPVPNLERHFVGLMADLEYMRPAASAKMAVDLVNTLEWLDKLRASDEAVQKAKLYAGTSMEMQQQNYTMLSAGAIRQFKKIAQSYIERAKITKGTDYAKSFQRSLPEALSRYRNYLLKRETTTTPVKYALVLLYSQFEDMYSLINPELKPHIRAYIITAARSGTPDHPSRLFLTKILGDAQEWLLDATARTFTLAWASGVIGVITGLFLSIPHNNWNHHHMLAILLFIVSVLSLGISCISLARWWLQLKKINQALERADEEDIPGY